MVMAAAMSSGLITPDAEGPASRLATLPAWDWDIADPAAPRTLGWHAIAWVEGWKDFPGSDGFGGLRQPNGPRRGRTIRFTSDQQTFLLWWYALDDEAQWLFRQACRRLAKGSGKSPFAAILSLIEFCGPCRLDRFDDRFPGGTRAMPEPMPLVQIAGTSWENTKNTMRMVRAMAPKGSEIVDRYGLDVGKTQYYRVPEGELHVITSSVATVEGAEATFAVVDESEHWTPNKGGPELMATIADNLAKSGSRFIETCNAWEVGKESVAEATYSGWLAQEEGKTRGSSRILYDARIAPPDTDMSDPDSLGSALHFVYGDCDWKKPHGTDGEPSAEGVPDVRSVMERIWDPSATPEDSARKYLNWPTTAQNAWVDPEDWLRLVDRDVVVSDGDEIVLFFDGSKSSDTTALIGCRVSDGFVFTVGVWEPLATGQDVDVIEVDAAVADAFDRWSVVGFFGDVVEWESFVKIEWPRLYGDRLEVWAIPGGDNAEVIAWDMRNRGQDFTKACELTLDEILSEGFAHDGDSRVARHVANARRRPNRHGVSIGKESRDSPRKIDAAVCVVGARMVRRRVLAHRKQSDGKSKQSGPAQMYRW